MSDLDRYVTERNEMLLAGDVDRMIAFMMKHGIPAPSSREVAEIAMHQAITGVKGLPMEHRSASKRWLVERGHQPFDDGDVPI